MVLGDVRAKAGSCMTVDYTGLDDRDRFHDVQMIKEKRNNYARQLTTEEVSAACARYYKYMIEKLTEEIIEAEAEEAENG